MIESIILQNFQSHRRREVKLDRNITTLIGSNDVGKTAILRALRWVVFNQPSGKSFIQHGKESATVSVKVGKNVIKRSRGKSNSYRLNDTTYKAFGSSPPDAISSVFNLGDVNFQNQHDPPFWFSLTPGQISKELNAIVNLDKIDKSLAHIAKKLRGTRSAISITKERLKEAKEQKKELNYVLEMDSELRDIEDLSTVCLRLNNKEGILGGLIHSYLETKGKRTANASFVREGREIVRLHQQKPKAEEETEELGGLIEEGERARINSKLSVPAVTELSKLYDRAMRLDDSAEELQSLIEQAETLKKFIFREMKELDDISHNHLDSILNEGETCPLCGQKIKKSSR